MEKITEKDVEFLRNKYERLQTELQELKQDLNHFKPQTGRQTERFLTTRRTTQKVFVLEQPNKRKVNNRIRLELYELVSGIHVEEISFHYYPIRNESGKVIDSKYFKFTVEATINQLKFKLLYVSDQNIEDCFEDKIQSYEIKELEIIMKKKIHQAELKDALQYFNKIPSEMGLALLCLKDYEKLYNIRLTIKKLLSKENPNILKCNFIEDDDENVFLEMLVYGKDRNYFTINWSIVWNDNIKTVADKFDIIVEFQDEEFLESVNPNFKKLTTDNLLKIIVSNKNDEKMQKDSEDSYVLSETEKLTLLRNSILAAKAAE